MATTVKGLAGIEKFMKRYVQNIDSAAKRGQEKAGQGVLALSHTLAPFDTGDMIELSAVRRDGDNVLVQYDAEHALYVHEDLTARHTKGQAKFLEEATRQSPRRVVASIAAEMRKVR